MVQALVQTELELFVSPLEFNELEDFALLPPADEFTLELDFAELLDLAEDFPPVEDFTELLEAELVVEISPADSGATPEEDSSSPQAVRLIVAIRARTGREKIFMSRGG